MGAGEMALGKAELLHDLWQPPTACRAPRAASYHAVVLTTERDGWSWFWDRFCNYDPQYCCLVLSRETVCSRRNLALCWLKKDSMSKGGKNDPPSHTRYIFCSILISWQFENVVSLIMPFIIILPIKFLWCLEMFINHGSLPFDMGLVRHPAC